MMATTDDQSERLPVISLCIWLHFLVLKLGIGGNGGENEKGIRLMPGVRILEEL